MKNKKNLIRLSIALLIFNLALGAFAVFSEWTAQRELSRASDVSSQNEVLGVSNIPVFNPNFIMSNQTFSSTRVFPNVESVQAYLDRTGSPLRNFSPDGKPASYWIFAASRGQTSSRWGVTPNINPGVILAYLEKEQSLISLRNYDVNSDPERRIRSAMGYGCPDTAECDQKYYGFVNQVNWAAYQLQFNYNNALSNRNVAPYNVNNTITTLDEYNVFLTNEATAANYRYTPHVYWGNYNLWKIIVANGWGVDTNTYSMAEIDSVNLAGKDRNITIDNVPRVEFRDVEAALRRNYTLGARSEAISQIQRFLRQEGYFMNREITGVYGVVTDTALKNYRADKGIVTMLSSERQEACLPLINRNFTIGQVNDDVRNLQRCLRELGVFTWPTITGFFGEVTRKGQLAARTALGSQANTPVPESNNSNSNTNTNPNPPAEPPQTGSNTNSSQPGQCDSFKSQTYRLGESGPRVRELQECLQRIGLFSWRFGATGFFGPVTQAAFNQLRGTTTQQRFTCDELKAQTWAMNERSDRVRQLQTCMQQAGTFRWSGGPTGFFGSVTRQALIAWRGYM